MIYLQLFWEFFKTGLFAVGGGMAAHQLAQGLIALLAVHPGLPLAQQVEVGPVKNEKVHAAIPPTPPAPSPGRLRGCL